MIKKVLSTLVCGAVFAITAQAQIRNSQGQLIPGANFQIPQIRLGGPVDRVERLKRMSHFLAEQIDLYASNLNDSDLSSVMELLKQAGVIVKSASGGENQFRLVDSDALLVSRKAGGEWITMKYDQPVDITQLNIRGIGAGFIKIYAINLVTATGQNMAVQVPAVPITSNSITPVYTGVQQPITYLQILAEGFKDQMSLGVDSFAPQVGQPLPPPIINPTVTGPILPHPESQQPRITCVSRDNDGSNPFIMAVREGVMDNKIQGTVFSNKQDCEKSITTMQYKAGIGMFCATRDNDGRNPYVLGVLDLGKKTFNRINNKFIFNDNTSCLRTLNESRDSGNGLTLCASSDSDGRNPFSMYFLGRDLKVQQGTEQYSNYDTCKANL